ncbi:MAG: hypothetical protein NUV65_03670 [Candidatus Roizmanbacteria bacterium]|nr:hypothetical protein [Candidatus Roizmanbacteria bacterium]
MSIEKENVRFKLDQLRKDKIIYAIESCATNTICLFGFLFSNQYFHNPLRDTVNILLLLIAIGYTLYMGVGNSKRLLNIKKLEKTI